MDYIPEDKILRFHPDTMQTVRKMYNLDRPGDMDNAITVLEDWLKKQNHLTRKEYPRTYLERSIILQKGSLERTKAQINNICAMRTLLPEFFVNDDKTFPKLKNEICSAGFLPTLTEDSYRVIAIKMLSKEINAQIFFVMFKYLIEYFKINDYCCGIVIILDYRDINIMDYATAVNITEFYQLIKILMVGYHVRIKGIHALTASKAIYAFVNLVKKMFGSKVGNRIHLHPNVEELYEFIPRDILQAEFGGYERTLASLWVEIKELLTSEKNVEYIKEMSEAKSTQAYKIKETIKYTDFGVSGSFRSLNVD